jgi:hypothetical protein
VIGVPGGLRRRAKRGSGRRSTPWRTAAPPAWSTAELPAVRWSAVIAGSPGEAGARGLSGRTGVPPVPSVRPGRRSCSRIHRHPSCRAHASHAWRDFQAATSRGPSSMACSTRPAPRCTCTSTTPTPRPAKPSTNNASSPSCNCTPVRPSSASPAPRVPPSRHCLRRSLRRSASPSATPSPFAIGPVLERLSRALCKILQRWDCCLRLFTCGQALTRRARIGAPQKTLSADLGDSSMSALE